MNLVSHGAIRKFPYRKSCKIPVRITKRSNVTAKPRCTPHNLIRITLSNLVQRVTLNGTSMLAVPKFMFVNTCSLAKTKNRQRVVVALESDLFQNDINICVVTQTHLKHDMPDAVVNIPNYTIFRRDRNWGGKDTKS